MSPPPTRTSKENSPHPSEQAKAVEFKAELDRLTAGANVTVQHHSSGNFCATTEVYELFKCVPLSNEYMSILYPLPADVKPPEVDFVGLLHKSKDEVCQKVLDDVLTRGTNKVAVDTSTTSCGLFMPARAMPEFVLNVDPDAVYLPTSKADCTDLFSPQCIEIKVSPVTATPSSEATSATVSCAHIYRGVYKRHAG